MPLNLPSNGVGVAAIGVEGKATLGPIFYQIGYLTYQPENHTVMVGYEPDELTVPVCELEGIRGGDTGFSVCLVRGTKSGRVKLRAINEGGFSCTEVDLLDLVLWLAQVVPGAIDSERVEFALSRFALGERPDSHRQVHRCATLLPSPARFANHPGDMFGVGAGQDGFREGNSLHGIHRQIHN